MAILYADFNPRVVEGLLEGAREALAEMGASRGRAVRRCPAPSSCRWRPGPPRSAGFDAVVALGAVIRGETDHYEHIAREAASGLAAVALETGVPVGFGVLTVADEAQALARSAPGPENKGAEAARAAVAMVARCASSATSPRARVRRASASSQSGRADARRAMGVKGSHGKRTRRASARCRCSTSGT